MFYTDPTNVLIHKLRAQLGRRVHNLASVEYQERTVDYKGDWATKNELQLDWKKVRAEANVDFEADIFPPIWAFVVENVRASKSKSVRLLVWLWEDDGQGDVKMISQEIFPLPLAGIRLRGEDKFSPQDPLAKAVRSGRGRDFVDAVIGEAASIADEVGGELEARAKSEAQQLRSKGRKMLNEAFDGFFDGLKRGLGRKDDGKKK